MKNREPEELEKLARDIHHGLVFTDRHIENPEDFPMVFMPLALMDKKALKKLQKDKPGMAYEYMSKAAPRSIASMPCFFSVNFLSEEDTEKVILICRALEKAEKKVLKATRRKEEQT